MGSTQFPINPTQDMRFTHLISNGSAAFTKRLEYKRWSKGMLKYKGYIGVVEYDDTGKIFTGEVAGLTSVITFQGRTPEELEASFRESIDLYLQMCAEDGVKPEKTYSGKFNVRIDPELHRELAVKALMEKKSINDLVNEALHRWLS
jgi:predicted HicB family RNase H-like nuclease